MKTLLLTSDGFDGEDVRKEILKVLPKPPPEIKLAHITTASKPEKSTSYVKRDRQAMIKVGFQVEDVDIEGKSKTELQYLLKDKDVVYVQGGNTFYLLKCIKESGFDDVVKKLIKRGTIYIGVSAGSYIACPTIEMALWDHQDVNIVGLKDLTALNLIPFLLLVHYEPKHKSALEKAVLNAHWPVRILKNNQALLVKDGQTRLVGEGKAIKIRQQ